MKLSIITVTFNSAATIRDTIESVLAQTYPNIEHIIVDGQSTDDTMPIINSFGNRIAKVISEPDKGISDAMNKGIALSTGNIIGILNSDDFYAHDRVLEDIVQTFLREDTDSVYGDLHYVHPENTDKVMRDWKSGSYNRRKFLYGWMVPHPTFFVRREVYEKYGMFNDSFRCAGDYELMIRLLYKHQIRATYQEDVLVKMRMGGNSNMSIKHRRIAHREDRNSWHLNGVKPYPFTTLLKPLRKITQFFVPQPRVQQPEPKPAYPRMPG